VSIGNCPVDAILLSLVLMVGAAQAREAAQRFDVGAQDETFLGVRHIRYSFTLQNQRNQLSGKAEVWLFAPVRQTSSQRCLSLVCSHPAELVADALGNQVLSFEFEAIPPFGAKIIRVSSEVAFSGAPSAVPDPKPEAFLAPATFIESDHAEVRVLARRLATGKTAEDTARAVYRWIAGNVQNPGFTSRPRGALFALRRKQGDCSEQAFLFAALCRAKGVPCRYMSGYMVTKSAILMPYGFHNWAEFHDGGAWRVADPSEEIFMEREDNFLAVRVAGPGAVEPVADFRRFRVRGEGLTLRMNAE